MCSRMAHRPITDLPTRSTFRLGNLHDGFQPVYSDIIEYESDRSSAGWLRCHRHCTMHLHINLSDLGSLLDARTLVTMT